MNDDGVKEFLKKYKGDIDGYMPLFFKGKVIYGEKEQIKNVKKTFNEFYDLYSSENNKKIFNNAHNEGILSDINYNDLVYLHLFQSLSIMMVFFKKSCFESEHEYRFAIFDYKNMDGEDIPKIMSYRFRTIEQYIVPYVEMPFDNKQILGVKLSPVNVEESSRLSLYKFLLAHDIQTKVDFSSIPLRF